MGKRCFFHENLFALTCQIQKRFRKELYSFFCIQTKIIITKIRESVSTELTEMIQVFIGANSAAFVDYSRLSRFFQGENHLAFEFKIALFRFFFNGKPLFITQKTP